MPDDPTDQPGTEASWSKPSPAPAAVPRRRTPAAATEAESIAARMQELEDRLAAEAAEVAEVAEVAAARKRAAAKEAAEQAAAVVAEAPAVRAAPVKVASSRAPAPVKVASSNPRPPVKVATAGTASTVTPEVAVPAPVQVAVPVEVAVQDVAVEGAAPEAFAQAPDVSAETSADEELSASAEAPTEAPTAAPVKKAAAKKAAPRKAAPKKAAPKKAAAAPAGSAPAGSQPAPVAPITRPRRAPEPVTLFPVVTEARSDTVAGPSSRGGLWAAVVLVVLLLAAAAGLGTAAIVKDRDPVWESRSTVRLLPGPASSVSTSKALADGQVRYVEKVRNAGFTAVAALKAGMPDSEIPETAVAQRGKDGALVLVVSATTDKGAIALANAAAVTLVDTIVSDQKLVASAPGDQLGATAVGPALSATRTTPTNASIAIAGLLAAVAVLLIAGLVIALSGRKK